MSRAGLCRLGLHRLTGIPSAERARARGETFAEIACVCSVRLGRHRRRHWHMDRHDSDSSASGRAVMLPGGRLGPQRPSAMGRGGEGRRGDCHEVASARGPCPVRSVRHVDFHGRGANDEHRLAQGVMGNRAVPQHGHGIGDVGCPARRNEHSRQRDAAQSRRFHPRGCTERA